MADVTGGGGASPLPRPTPLQPRTILANAGSPRTSEPGSEQGLCGCVVLSTTETSTTATTTTSKRTTTPLSVTRSTRFSSITVTPVPVKPLSKPVRIGLGVGLALSCTLLVALCVCILWKRRRQRQRPAFTSVDKPPDPPAFLDPTQAVELGTDARPVKTQPVETRQVETQPVEMATELDGGASLFVTAGQSASGPIGTAAGSSPSELEATEIRRKPVGSAGVAIPRGVEQQQMMSANSNMAGEQLASVSPGPSVSPLSGTSEVQAYNTITPPDTARTRSAAAASQLTPLPQATTLYPPADPGRLWAAPSGYMEGSAGQPPSSDNSDELSRLLAEQERLENRHRTLLELKQVDEERAALQERIAALKAQIESHQSDAGI